MSRLLTLSATEITSDRLMLRKAHDIDREGFIEIFTDHEVRAYLGGPKPRSEVEQFLDALGTANTTSEPGRTGIRQTDTGSLGRELQMASNSAVSKGSRRHEAIRSTRTWYRPMVDQVRSCPPISALPSAIAVIHSLAPLSTSRMWMRKLPSASSRRLRK